MAKLIRDRIAPHGKPEETIVDGMDLCRLLMHDPAESGFKAALLVAKLLEESAELAKSMDSAEEYADVLQVLRDLAKLNGVDWGAVENKRWTKYAKLGGFSEGRFLIVSSDGEQK